MKNGIIKKVAALDKVLLICNAHGANYNPGNAALQPTALAALLQFAQEKSKAVIAAQASYVMASNARSESFEGIPKLAAKIARMVSASPASKKDKEDVRRVKARFHTSSKTKPSTTTAGQDATSLTPAVTRSISRRDRDSIIDNLTHLVELVQTIPAYNPNEPEFKIEGLKAKIAELHALNLAAAQAKIDLSNARIALSKVIAGEGGVIESTRSAKDYIRAKFGMISKESQQVSKPSNY